MYSIEKYKKKNYNMKHLKKFEIKTLENGQPIKYRNGELVKLNRRSLDFDKTYDIYYFDQLKFYMDQNFNYFEVIQGSFIGDRMYYSLRNIITEDEELKCQPHHTLSKLNLAKEDIDIEERKAAYELFLSTKKFNI